VTRPATATATRAVTGRWVYRIWRREGLKIPMKQPKRGRLWLNDSRACVQPNHVWSDFPLWDVLWMMRRASFPERTMRELPQRHSAIHLPVRAARRAAQKKARLMRIVA